MESGNILSSTATAVQNTQQNNLLAQEDFFAILTAQLTNQDPLEPMDNQDFLGQLAQLNTLQSTAALTETLNALLLQQTLASGASLLGKVVRGTSETGQEVTNVVNAVTSEGGKVKLLVGDQVVLMEDVIEILNLNVS